MRFSIAAVAATLATAHAFKDTSPFLLFSNSPNEISSKLRQESTLQLQSKSQLLSSVREVLSECSSEIYYIISTPSVSPSELSLNAPHLAKAISNPAVQTRMLVREVMGMERVDADDLAAYLEEKCAAKITNHVYPAEVFAARKGNEAMVVRWAERPDDIRTMADRDNELFNAVLKDLPKGYKYTVIYTTTPSTEDNPVTYEAAFDEPFRMDLKRDMFARHEPAFANSTDTRPLFEKYQFLSPGIFHGLVVGAILLSILGVGMSALGSLEVSYGAFDKEMGPAAQKKQQ